MNNFEISISVCTPTFSEIHFDRCSVARTIRLFSTLISSTIR